MTEKKVVVDQEEGSISPLDLIFPFLANHFRLPILVSRCDPTGWPPATSVVLILLR